MKEMENKSTLQISKELGRKYDSVLAFVREVQEIAEKIEGKISLKDLIEIDEVYITGEKGIKQDRPRRRGFKKEGVEGYTREINHQCRHLLKGEGKQGSLSKGTYQKPIRMRGLKQSLKVR